MSLVLAIYLLALLFTFFVAGCLIGAIFSKPVRKTLVKIIGRVFRRDLLLARVRHNPILVPGAHPWQAEAVLNPAAVALGGRTHLMYRAIGSDGLSRLGYASSANGIIFDDRLPYPAYVTQDPSAPRAMRRYSPMLYPSGGSWGGCEDPRMVAIDGRVYVTFNMFENWVLRVGCISIREDDFLAKRFHAWEGPIILSHGDRAKNWVLFPEKIRGQFAILHSIIGERDDEVRIEYVDHLEELRTRRFTSPDPQQVPDKHIAWHSHLRSAGPPPLKTTRGWLVFYHANDAEWQKYKLGAMLLDLEDPTRVIARARTPILVPEESYENNGKPGIVYACGAVERDGMLYMYYGAADKVVCVAFAPLETFVTALIEDTQAALSAQAVQTV